MLVFVVCCISQLLLLLLLLVFDKTRSKKRKVRIKKCVLLGFLSQCDSKTKNGYNLEVYSRDPPSSFLLKYEVQPKRPLPILSVSYLYHHYSPTNFPAFPHLATNSKLTNTTNSLLNFPTGPFHSPRPTVLYWFPSLKTLSLKVDPF